MLHLRQCCGLNQPPRSKNNSNMIITNFFSKLSFKGNLDQFQSFVVCRKQLLNFLGWCDFSVTECCSLSLWNISYEAVVPKTKPAGAVEARRVDYSNLLDPVQLTAQTISQKSQNWANLFGIKDAECTRRLRSRIMTRFDFTFCTLWQTWLSLSWGMPGANSDQVSGIWLVSEQSSDFVRLDIVQFTPGQGRILRVTQLSLAEEDPSWPKH